jgi:tetraacyldisaccharide 4'-kinase
MNTRALLAPLALLYGAGVSVRHKLYDWGWRRTHSFDIPILCVGNLTVGGTGKTPVVEMLVRGLGGEFNIAVLSRGYGRCTKGYLEVMPGMPYRQTGDEPKQVKRKFPEVVVVVCERREEGIERIREEHPEVNLIILDDGFQYRGVEAWVNIVLVDYTRPVWADHLLPWGSLRDTLSQMPRAHYVLFTKCPADMNALDRRIARKSLKLFPYQGLYFTHTSQGALVPAFAEGAHKVPHPGGQVIAMSGIGNPAAFEQGLAAGYDVVGALRYADHHPYRTRDLRDMQSELDRFPRASIVATEKDAVKFTGSSQVPAEIRERLFYAPVRVVFDENCEDDFFKKLKNDLRTTPRERFLHSQ